MSKIMKREEVDDKYKWDLTKIYSSDEEIAKDMKLVKEKANDLLKYKGKLTSSSDNLLKATDDYFDLMRIMDKLIVYAHMKSDEDKSVAKSEELVGKIDRLSDEISELLAFYSPELLGNDYELVEKYISENDGLKKYDFMFKDLFREKDHILSLEQEEMMARLGEVFSVSENAFRMLDDVNMKFGFIKDEDGKKQELTGTNYSTYLKSRDRRVRRDAFESLYNAYNDFKQTYAALLKGNVKSNFFVSNTRKYNSPLDMSLYSDNIDKKLYYSLIEKVHNNLDIMEDYMKLRKEILGLDEVHMYDVYAPLVDNISKKFTYEEAKELVLKALEPLGETYINDLKSIFESGCIDVYNNKGKRSGAYSWGSYDTLPYVLLNFEGKFTDVSTVAHELGHSMHSFYSHKYQEYHDSGYPIFLAEIASTVNEIFLNRYCSLHAETKEEKAYYLNNLLENFRTTLIRQTMFAEFELKIHDLEESGEVLTEELLCDTYLDLNKKYFTDAAVSDDLIKLEWARIPHFYTSFYVYKYATGISVACRIVSDILDKKEGALDNYMKFLSSGGNDFPLEILRKTGIDIANDNTIDKALEMFRETLKEFKEIIS